MEGGDWRVVDMLVNIFVPLSLKLCDLIVTATASGDRGQDSSISLL